MTTQETNVESLITKASQAKDPVSALQFSQAACNSANALCALATFRRNT